MPRTAVEYATDQITVYRYCRYGCAYCYVWRLGFYSRRVRSGRYDPVEEAERYLRAEGRTIVVSFVSDPYPPEEHEQRLTRRVLETLARNPRNRVLVLTKNPALALRDLDLMRRHGDMWLGTTVTTLWEDTLLEPGAPPAAERLGALEEASASGVPTWLSVEPIVPGHTELEQIIMHTYRYVDWYVLGALNYSGHLHLLQALARVPLNREVLRAYYRSTVPGAVRLLERLGKRYHVKRELRELLG